MYAWSMGEGEVRDAGEESEGTPAELVLSAALATVGGGLGGVIGGPLGAAVAAGVSQSLVDLARYRLALANEATSRAAEEAGGVDLLVEALHSDERLAMTQLNVMDTAARTSLAAKRRVLGRAVGQAAVDPAEIDTAQLRELALRDLDAPHLQTLARIHDAEATISGTAEPPDLRKREKSPDEVREAGLRVPVAVIRGLDRHGLVQTVTGYGGNTILHGITAEGVALLDELEQEGGFGD